MTRIPSVEPPRVGITLAELRQMRALSLDELSKRAGVSKSMLSQIERNQANPTVAVLWRVSKAPGIEPARFLSSGSAPAAGGGVQVFFAPAPPLLQKGGGENGLATLWPLYL